MQIRAHVPNLPSVASPYSRFNLRRNPFGELSFEERAELAVINANQWLEALRRPTTAIQFIGEKGYGKTTHLLAIHRLLPEAAYVYLREDAPQPHIPKQRPLLIDEAQRLRRITRYLTFRAGGPLVLGTHQDFSKPLSRAGFDLITVDVGGENCPQRLQRILNLRIEASRLSAAAVPHITVSQVVDLQRRFGCNIRLIEHFLYSQFQDAVQKGLPWPHAN